MREEVQENVRMPLGQKSGMAEEVGRAKEWRNPEGDDD
jgi:hypothetical protein